MAKWSALLSQSAQYVRGSAVRELFEMVRRPGVISFAGGMPAPELFLCEEISQACAKVLREQGAVALQYGQTGGYDPLRDYIAEEVMAGLGLWARRENVLITSGGSQAIDLVTRVLLDPGEAIILGKPTFLGALGIFAPYRPRYLTIPVDDRGMQVDRLEEILAREEGIKFVYVMPNFHNPAGCTLSLERRHKLVALAGRYGIPVLEDDPYNHLRYSGEPLPPLIVLDQESAEQAAAEGAYHEGNVLYAGSFSKSISPGMRLGWVVGPVPIIAQMTRLKQGVDLHTNLLAQMIAYELCRQDFFPDYIAHLCQVYRGRRDLMLALMQKHFPPQVTWTEPEGGLFIWAALPEGVDAESVLVSAVEQGVAYVPGRAFYAVEGGENTFRLNFSNANEEQIERGIALLGTVLRRALNA